MEEFICASFNQIPASLLAAPIKKLTVQADTDQYPVLEDEIYAKDQLGEIQIEVRGYYFYTSENLTLKVVSGDVMDFAAGMPQIWKYMIENKTTERARFAIYNKNEWRDPIISFDKDEGGFCILKKN